ncbi:MAG: hypothetical protein BWY95_00302 [Bacteroidetes bacterium ADurb.BinA104]|nr:MAG: hypothetical protein BWY95_00302 [Bacteroidetes bacterium ADurb.BinA104]
MPLPMLALQVAPAVMKLGYSLFNKPKRSDYENKHTSEALNKIISNNQADIVNKTLLNQTTSAAKSLGARLYQKAEHGLDVAANKGLLSEGQKANAMLGAATSIQSEVGNQQQLALLANTQHSAALNEKVENATLQLAQMKDQAAMAYKADKNAWGANIAESAIELGSLAASHGVDKMMVSKLKESGALDGKPANLADWSADDLMGLMFRIQLMKSGFGSLFGG